MKFKRVFKAFIHRDLSYFNKRWSRQGLYEFLRDEFEKIDRNENVLSVGAGGGVNRLLGEFAAQHSFSFLQMDIDESRNPDVVGDLCQVDLQLDKSPFSSIVCSEVLEHCHDPFAAVENLHRNLQKGGKLILTTPFIFPVHEEPVDFFRFTEYGLKHLLRNFESINVRSSNCYAESWNVLLVRYDGLGRIGRWLTTALAYMISPLVWFLSRGGNRLGTTRYLVVARK